MGDLVLRGFFLVGFFSRLFFTPWHGGKGAVEVGGAWYALSSEWYFRYKRIFGGGLDIIASSGGIVHINRKLNGHSMYELPLI